MRLTFKEFTGKQFKRLRGMQQSLELKRALSDVDALKKLEHNAQLLHKQEKQVFMKLLNEQCNHNEDLKQSLQKTESLLETVAQDAAGYAGYKASAAHLAQEMETCSNKM